MENTKIQSKPAQTAASHHKKDLEWLGRQILSASRDELYMSMRFFDSAFAALSYEMNLNTRYLGTDGNYIYFNPAFLMKQYQEDTVLVNRAYLHMVFHCIFRHMANRGERKEEQWNLACDISVEALLDSIEDKSVQSLVPDKRQELYKKLHEKMKVLTAEGIYHYLEQERFSFEELLHLEQLFQVDDHQFFEAPKKQKENDGAGENENQSKEKGDSKEENENRNQEKEDTRKESEIRNQEKENQEALSALSEKWKHISESMKINMETFCMEAGARAGGLLAYLSVEEEQEYNFYDFLRKFTRPKETARLDEDAFDLAFYTYGLELYGNLPLIEPLEYREEKKIEEFIIVLDTSGSCQAGEVEEFLKDTFAVLKDSRLFTKRYKIHLLQCDTVVHSDILVTSIAQAEELRKSFTMYGGGGTDFRAAFDYVEQQRGEGKMNAVSGLLYFTDGYGTFPVKRPDYDTAFIFWRENFEDIPVPPWALKQLRKKEENNGY